MKAKDDFSYRMYTTKSEAHKAFNSLVGIIDGILLDSKINQKEIEELERWCDNHDFLAKSNPFKDLITNIQVIISDNIVTEEEISDMKWLCNKFKGGFEYFDEYTSDLQELQGICHGILADGIINEKEIIGLNNWLMTNQHLTSYYPYDEITGIISEVLSDGKIDDEEKMILKKYFIEFVNLSDCELQNQIKDEVRNVNIYGICSKVSSIQLIDNQFCFTGKSSRSTRNDIAKLIEEYGGTFVNSISKNTNYLIVGDDGNPCWAYACYGRKVEYAINIRKEGGQVVIIHENDFWKEIDERRL